MKSMGSGYGRALVRMAIVAIAVAGIPCAMLAADVPVSVQLNLYQKIWKLDRSLGARPELVLAVLYQETYATSSEAREAVMIWAEASGVRCVFVALDQKTAEAALLNVVADVFYVTPMRGADIQQIARIARARRIRTMAGLTEYVAIGLSVGIGVRNDRPRIMINLDAAKAEGAAYQAQLLQMAEIVKARSAVR
ncbi:MAG: YfiR family protein [Acidobacteriota bacterium]|nr:YfiR family protein [Acidobacteriota bacterium]